MNVKRNPVALGIIVLVGILLAVMAILSIFWPSLSAEARATVVIGGVSALATATLAVATFWTIKQNERTLKDLQRERRKPVILNLLAEFIDPAIEKAEANKPKLEGKTKAINAGNRTPFSTDLLVSRPPSRQEIDTATWEEIQERYPEFHSDCELWWNQVGVLKDAADDLGQTILEAEEYDGSANQPRALESILNSTQYAEGVDPPVDNLDEYREVMFQHYSEKHHKFWRTQWELLKLNHSLHSDAVELKRRLQAEYGVSNREIAEHQDNL